jgi:predicted NUDIX family NTP pyrophosphohydrolase
MTQSKRAKVSAGLLMYRARAGALEVFLAHPGGPFFAKKDEGWWSIPKGEIEEGDGPLETALREFEEETGLRPGGEMIPLGEVRQKGGKLVHAWAFEGDWEEGRALVCNTFSMEWPPGSGRRQEFAEIDRVAFFDLETARRKMNQAQAAFLDALAAKLARPG